MVMDFALESKPAMLISHIVDIMIFKQEYSELYHLEINEFEENLNKCNIHALTSSSFYDNENSFHSIHLLNTKSYK